MKLFCMLFVFATYWTFTLCAKYVLHPAGRIHLNTSCVKKNLIYFINHISVRSWVDQALFYLHFLFFFPFKEFKGAPVASFAGRKQDFIFIFQTWHCLVWKRRECSSEILYRALNLAVYSHYSQGIFMDEENNSINSKPRMWLIVSEQDWFLGNELCVI